ncbi:MAG: Uncharacterized protein G01um101418_254 [Parcubacteria group bacterium Gr01-1014_18]|nr:MAG: Uncharacterized protein Greene041636_221 [Parcubacteria group bacterium Greene0416_36]TSC81272.1 MAG: Uncharacterized protein G01um101418_254 [Parcubacteria group bacterium Gr01-1014_18]TSC99294.1 MAG: Uncharacterized protein Greene101420_222 [Parcubacteria group bacterium Greene1014_20]TSD06869.1 MAG: Uncharacterized protein Greene07142_603 [Parcubacteria group bacterium Greene0714_2]
MNSEKIKDFFFEAMREGWAVQSPKIPISNLPGSKSIPYSKGEYFLLDYYFVAPNSNSSYGSTVIWIAGRPVWLMHYGGWYDEPVIPFLKRALMQNYSENFFWGGRGPERLEGESHTLQYLNNVEQNDFNSFRGSEYIISTSDQSGKPEGQKLGGHHYFGGLFV